MKIVKKNNFTVSFVILLLITFFTGAAWCKETPAVKITVPEVKYSQFSLKNGLKIYVFEDHLVPLVEVKLWYHVGSVDEPEGITGISHLLEHTMFLGTEALQKDQVHKLVKQVGGRNNASTSNDYTAYYETVPAVNLELALAIEADRMHNLKIDPEEFQREKEVVKQERRRSRENDAIRSAYEEIKAAAFTASPLHHEVIGWMPDIDALTVEKLQNHYQRYYRPNNAILTVTGDVTPKRVFELAGQYFGDYQPGQTTRNIPKEPEQKEERKLTIEKLTNVPYIIMLYKLPEGNHPDRAAIEFLLDILVDRSTSRVNLELQQKKELILGAGSWSVNLSIPGYAQIVLVPVAEDKITAVAAGFDTQLDRLIQNGVTDEELLIIKKSVLKDLIFSQRTITEFADYVTLGDLYFNDPEYYKKHLNNIDKLTKEDIARVAKQYFTKERRTIGYVIPQKSDPGETKQK
jgi:zinc protease